MNAAMILTLASLGLGGCGGDGGGTGPEVPEGQALVVITVTFANGVPAVRQIQVAAHAGGVGDADLYFPTTVGGPIVSGSTLGILVPNSGTVPLVDLVLRGLTNSLDAGGTAVARGTGQAMIVTGSSGVERTIVLEPCGASGC